MQHINVLLVFGLLIVCCWCLDRPVIIARNGNLRIAAAPGANIELKVTSGGKLLLQNEDISETIKSMSSSLETLQQCSLDSKMALTKIRLFEDDLNSNAVLTRLNSLETSNNNTKRLVFLISRPMRRRINNIQKRLTSLIQNLAQNECNSNPCQHGGTCQDLYNTYNCVCPSNWEGGNCENDVNECDKFRGTELGCQNDAKCVNTPGGYECKCTDGWIGAHCIKRTQDCNNSVEVCGHGTCIPLSNGIKCLCDQGWKTDGKQSCTVDINECDTYHPPCSSNPPVKCINLPGTFYCGHCPAGYTGNGFYCSDINECEILNGGCSMYPMVQCVNVPGSRICGSCPPGYVGDGVTCTFQGVCGVSNGGCHPMAQCRDNPRISNTYVECICPQSYSGDGFGPNGCVPGGSQDSCASNPCMFGTCVSKAGGYTCNCTRQYTGRNCDIRKDGCSSNPCQNGGTCRAFSFSYICTCPAGFSGPNCLNNVLQCGQLLGANGNISYPPADFEFSRNSQISCAVRIKTTPNKVLNVSIHQIYVPVCGHNYLQIHDGKDTGSPLIGRFCDNKLKNGSNLISSTDSLYVWLKGDALAPKPSINMSWISINPVCGSYIDVMEPGTFKSPGSPQNYPPNRDCYWKLKAPMNKRIKFTFYHMDIGNNSDCTKDYIAFNEGLEASNTYFFQRCTTGIVEPILSPTNEVTVHLHTVGSYSGFLVHYSQIDGMSGCGGIYTHSSGTISSPKLMLDDSEITCEYKIQLNFNSHIKLHFNKLTSGVDTTGCTTENSILSVYTGSDTNSPLAGRYCGNLKPADMLIMGSQVLITNKHTSGSSFELEYATTCGGIYTDENGQIQSDNYPVQVKVDTHIECKFVIMRPPQNRIQIDIKGLDIGNGTNWRCEMGSLNIYAGDQENSTKPTQYCGKPDDTIYINNNIAIIKYIVKYGTTGGFSVNYKSLANSDCGGTRTEMSGTVETPRDLDTYEHGLNCTWQLSAPPGYLIEINWLTFNLEESYQCAYDYVLVFDNATDSDIQMGKYCGNRLPPSMTTTSNIATIYFQIDELNNYDGFYLTYRFISGATSCGGNYFSPSGIVKSPLYPLQYSNNRNCIWKITVPVGQQIQLNITSFNVEPSVNCRYDYLQILNGGFLTSPSIGKFCGNKIPKLIYSHTNQLTLQFMSDKTKTAPGFQLQWTTTATGCGGSLSSLSGSIISPNYPESYSRNAECFWKIAVAAGSKIQAIFADLDLEYLHGCHMDYVNFYDGLDTMAKSLGTYCQMDNNNKIIMSSGNHLTIKFHSDINYQGRGFHLQYSTMCKTNVTGFNGIIENPNFPDDPPRDQECEWQIQVPPGNAINITFSHFALLSASRNCDTTYLEINFEDTSTYEYKSLGKFCEEHPPDEEIHIKANIVKLKFRKGSSFLKSQFRLEWVLAGCGGMLTRPEGSLQTPNYPNGYPINTHCEWHIQTEFGKSIEITFHHIDMELNANCDLDYILVYNGPDKTYAEVAKICHSTDKATIVSGTGRDMFVLFVSDSSFSGKGFNASYRTLNSKCGGLLTATSGTFHSPNYPNNYDKNDTCEWLIEVQENHLIDLVFESVDLFNVCDQTYIKVYDGPTAAYPLLKTICGSAKPESKLTSRTNHLYVELVTLALLTTKGFKAKYSTAYGARIQTQGSGLINYSSSALSVTNVTDCSWTIIAENPQEHVLLTFSEFQSSQCFSDYSTYAPLKIYDGENYNSSILGTYCEKMPGVLRSNGNTLFIYLPEKFDQMNFKAKYSVVDTGCGGTFASEKGEIASPNYPSPYPTDIQCEWKLSVGAGNEISLAFSLFDLLQSANCNEDYLEIREIDSSGRLIGTFCGSEKPINVTGVDSIWMYFKSDRPSNTSESNTGKGFLADFSISTFVELNGSNGTIVSPLYPNRFLSDHTYKWQITVPEGYNIEFEFNEMEFVMSSEYCYGATLAIMDGTEDDPTLKNLCALSENIKTTSNVATLVFQTLYGIRGALFKLKWKQMHTVNNTSQKCDQESMLLHNSNYTLTSEFTSPSNGTGILSARKQCSWTFNTQPGRHLRVKLIEYLPSSTNCFADKVSLSDGNGYGIGETITKPFGILYTFCPTMANNITNRTYDSVGNSLMVQHSVLLFNHMQTIYRTNLSKFIMDITDVCGGSITKSNGIIIVDASLEPITNNKLECNWKISVPTGKRISLTSFTNFTKTDNCDNKVVVYNGHNADAPIVQQTCGTPTKINTMTTGNVAYISFSGNYSSSIKIKFQAVSTTECGGSIDLTHIDNSTVITTPNYPNAPSMYAECIWQISVPNGEAVRIDFLERFDLEATYGCTIDGVEIRDGATSNSALIGTYCKDMPGTIRTFKNRIYIRYYTNSADPKNGFKAKVTIAFCGGTVRAVNGSIVTPGYKHVGSYPTNASCEWELVAPIGHNMNLTFDDFDMPWYSKVSITDVESYNTTENEIYNFTGKTPTNLLQSSSNKVIVRLFTGKHGPYKGFKLSFRSSAQRCGGELTEPYGTITSPNYPSPNTGRMGCDWLITAPKGRRVKLVFEDVHISRELGRSQGIACFSGDTFSSNILFLTDLHNYSKTVRSSDNIMKIYYWSHGVSQTRGFKASYTSDEPSVCAQSVIENGIIHRPTEKSFTCTWEPKPPMTKTQTLAFTIAIKYTGGSTSHRCAFSENAVYISQSQRGETDINFYSNILQQLCKTTDAPVIVRTLLPYPKIAANQKYNNSYLEFTIKYKVHDCGEEITSSDGTIASPQVATGSVVDCAWRLVGKEGEQLTLTTNSFQLSDCDVSYLLVYNGDSIKSPLIGKYCGANQLPTILSQRHFLWLEYHGNNISKFNVTYSKNSKICGGIHHDQSNKLQSPQYPQNYDNNVECLWELRAPNGYHIELTFTDRFQLEETDGCANDYLSIYERETDEKAARKYCGRNGPPKYKSFQNSLYILFRTNQMVTGSGFTAEWQWGCGGQFNATDSEQFLESPGYPEGYSSKLKCEYLISAPGKYIRITFKEFDLEKSSTCNFDKLIIDPGRNQLSYRKHAVLCGDTLPNVMRFYSQANLTFITDRWVNKRGFKLSYQIDSCGGNITAPMLLEETSAHNVRTTMPMYYSPVRRCTWNILAPSDKRIVVNFLKVNITYNIYCYSQYVSVADEKGLPMATLCGDLTDDLPTIHSNNNNLTLKFQYYNFGKMGTFGAIIDFVYGPEVGCGGFINLTTLKSQIINFKPPGNNYDCIWHAQSGIDYTIKVQFNVKGVASHCTKNDNTIYARENQTCCIYYQIRDGNTSLADEIFNGCDLSGNNPISYTSSGSVVQFRMVGQNKALEVPQITITSELSSCGHLNLTPTNDTQYITSPNFPGPYPKDLRCVWRIKTKYIHAIYLRFKVFDINSNINNITTCDGLDRIEIADRFNKAFHLNYDLVYKRKVSKWELNKLDSLIGQHTFCSPSDIEYDFTSTQNHIQISFFSNSQPKAGKGFQLEYKIANFNRNYTGLSGRIGRLWQIENSTAYIIAPENYTIALFFASTYQYLSSCNNRWFDIYDGSVTTTPVAKLCGGMLIKPIFSTGHQLIIRSSNTLRYGSYTSDMTYIASDKGRGCGGDVYMFKGTFTSPLYPNPPSSNMLCKWNIRVPMGLQLAFNLKWLDIKGKCEDNYVKIADPQQPNAASQIYCSKDQPAVFISSSGTLVVEYKTDSTNTGTGWKAAFMAITSDYDYEKFKAEK